MTKRKPWHSSEKHPQSMKCADIERFDDKGNSVKMGTSRVLGTGLVTLDVVLNGKPSTPQMTVAGGTCGNVLINLAFLGWESYPVARISRDEAGTLIERDLDKWQVRTDFLHMEPMTDTPIIIHRIRHAADGSVSHSFSWSCPKCRRRLPSYRPVTVEALRDIPIETIRPNVFFFDRPSPGALHMARAARVHDALVVFELAGRGTPGSLSEAIRVADIVKYSGERATEVPERDQSGQFIEIMTLGAKGISFRCNLRHCKQSRWKTLEAYPLAQVKDTAGAGDWCTAGLIHRLGSQGLAGLSRLKRDVLVETLRYSQALAAINCCFEGARGSMYALSSNDLDKSVQLLLKGKGLHLPHASTSGTPATQHEQCPVCGTISDHL